MFCLYFFEKITHFLEASVFSPEKMKDNKVSITRLQAPKGAYSQGLAYRLASGGHWRNACVRKSKLDCGMKVPYMQPQI